MKKFILIGAMIGAIPPAYNLITNFSTLPKWLGWIRMLFPSSVILMDVAPNTALWYQSYVFACVLNIGLFALAGLIIWLVWQNIILCYKPRRQEKGTQKRAEKGADLFS